MLGQRGKVVGEELGGVFGLGSEQRLEAVRVELGHALARNVRRHPLVGAEPARRLDIEGHHAALRGEAQQPRRAETDAGETCTEAISGRASRIRSWLKPGRSPQRKSAGFVVFPRGRREILYLDNAMSASVLRSLLCLLALGGVTALQVRPESSRLAAPRPVLRATTLVAAAAAAEDEGKAGLCASTANLVKSIVGSGVLSLPVGVAAFSSARTAILPALTLLAVAGAISGYCFSAVGRVCAATGSKSWGEAWSKSVGESTAWVPSALIGILTLSVSLQYTMVIGDSFSSIFSAWGLPSLIASRSGAIIFLTALGTP